MKTVFVWVESDEEYGNSGWLPTHMPNANAGDGRSVAHDAIEHAIADTAGWFEGECQAMGAIVAGRAQAGTVGTSFSPDWRQHVGSDLTAFIGGRFGNERDDIARCPYRVRVPSDVLYDMQEVFNIAKRDLVKHNDMSSHAVERLRPDIIDWMRHGYRRTCTAMRRAGLTPVRLSLLFDEVRCRCRSGEYDGQRMVVEVRLRREEVRFHTIDTEE